jgi:hypothetical protein
LHPHLLYPTCLLALGASFGIGLHMFPGASERPQATIALAAAGAVDIAPELPPAPISTAPAATVLPAPGAAAVPDAPRTTALLTPPDATTAGRFGKPEPEAAAPLLAKGTDGTSSTAQPDVAKPARAVGPARKKQVRREPAAKRPTGDALRTVRRFGDNLQDIPVTSYAGDGSRRTIVVRPTSIQDVYYYSARQ